MHSMAYSSQFPSPSSSSRSLSLSPAHSIKSTSKHHHHQHSRRPSPLKRQMSLGLGDPTSSSAALNIDPNRDHAAGPLAVLYSVKPDEDPLLAGGASPVKASPSTNNTILRGGALQHSPSSNNTSANVEIPPDTPRSVSALANLERTAVTAPLPSSPNRSLLAAFQAVSPRTQAVTAKSTSLPSLSNLGAAPRGVQPFQHSSLAPASPIYSSPKQSTRRNTYATAAFRALNGASPQKQVSASRNSRTEQSSNSASLPGTANVSPISSRSGSISRQAQSEVPSKSHIAYSPCVHFRGLTTRLHESMDRIP